MHTGDERENRGSDFMGKPHAPSQARARPRASRLAAFEFGYRADTEKVLRAV